MTDGIGTDRLAQLTSRFEADPTSRIFLQLAEEYRHLGRVKEALAVLERGLKEHPGYLAALVAKGRCHLELAEPETARDLLERVVKQDATQMVANKLLVRAYLETSEPDRAKSRLDLYSLLNESDPEIEELRRRIRAMLQPPKAEAPRAAAFDLFDLERPLNLPPRGPGDVFFEPPRPAPVPPPPTPAPSVATEVQAAVRTPVAVEPPVLAVAAEAGAGSSDGDVFPGLALPESFNRYLTGLAAEGLFPMVEAGPASAPTPPVAAVAAPSLSAAPQPQPAVAPPVPELIAPPAPETPEPVAPVVPVEPIATVTLGELYLAQGHGEEAERIFREVLRREPGNPAALAGLARLAEPVAPVLATAAVPAPPPEVPKPIDPIRAQRARLLRAYLQRIQQGRQRHVS